MHTESIIVSEGLKEVLREKLKDALVRRAVAAEDMTEFYLVNLLSQYHESQESFCPEGEDILSKPLALRFIEDTDGDMVTRRKGLRRLGDTALLIAGFYAERVRRGIVDISYYVGMGEAAYARLSSLQDEPVFASLYRELASKFSEFAEALSNLAPWNTASSDRDLVKIYERWIETGDENLKDLLEECGIRTDGEIV